MPVRPARDRSHVNDLQQIKNVGPSIAADFGRIGIRAPSDLCQADPYELYERLCQVDGQRHDPCVLDVFISAVEYMQGRPARPWWKYTARRKRELARRQKAAAHSGSPEDTPTALGRRAFLQRGVLFLLAGGTLSHTCRTGAAEPPGPALVRFGLLSDPHYADKAAAGNRHYRQTPTKLAEAGRQWASARVDFVVELGDLVDSGESLEMEQEFLRAIHRQFQDLPGRKHYVLGNHCVSRLTKNEFLETVGQPAAYYSCEVAPFHFVVLDACFRNDGQPYGRQNFDWTDSNISADELKWLQDDLMRAEHPAIVFIHQRLDVSDDYGVKNAVAVRELLERSGKVLAVFQGHNHKNDYREINGIHYVTLNAMVEGESADDNAYACVELFANNSLRMTGFRTQSSYHFER
jgi:alkaline phosphatase